MVRTRSLTAAASEATPRSGLAAAITRWPCAVSRSITPSQLDDSAKAPWTRTMVGCMKQVFSCLREGGRFHDARPFVFAERRSVLGAVGHVVDQRGDELPGAHRRQMQRRRFVTRAA